MNEDKKVVIKAVTLTDFLTNETILRNRISELECENKHLQDLLNNALDAVDKYCSLTEDDLEIVHEN